MTGRANVGKSTLINRITDTTVSITTDTPQTTRHPIKGIYNESDTQIVFVDTPGILKPRDEHREHLLKRTYKSWADSDVLLFVVDASQGVGEGDKFIARKINDRTSMPVILVPNKIDRISKSDFPAPVFDPETFQPDSTVPISAKTGTNVDNLIHSVKSLLPPGPRLYPTDVKTDRNLSFRISEIIRQEVIRSTYEEVPHSVEVVTETVNIDREEQTDLVEARIYVESGSQKGIVIGDNGKRIRTIGKQARRTIEEHLSNSIYLDLTVSVLEDWTNDRKKIRRIEDEKEVV